MNYVSMGAPPPKPGIAYNPSRVPTRPPADYVPPGVEVYESTPESNTTLIIGAVAAVAVIGGAIFFLSRKS
jgi:hypothetical protein